MTDQEILDNAPEGATIYSDFDESYIKWLKPLTGIYANPNDKYGFLVWNEKFGDWNHIAFPRIQTLISARSLSDIRKIAEFEKEQILSDCLVMANARALIKAKAITSNGRLYMQLFGTGLASAYAACRELGLEPEDNKTSYNAMREHLDALASAEQDNG